MKAYDAYNEKADYKLTSQSSYTCHSLTKATAERGGATNCPQGTFGLSGISWGD